MIQLTTAEIAAWIGSFLWPFFRIGAMVSAAPVFNARAVPVRIRVAIALALTLVIAPLAPPVPAVDPLSLEALLISVHQIVIGLALGFVLRLALGALELAGEAVAHLMGLSFASMIDPVNGVQAPVLSQFYLLLATLVFLAFNGHLMWVEALAESFRLLPVGAQGLTPQALWSLVTFGAELFAWGVRMALPVVAALLVINVAFGVLTRAAPQLNLFSVGFPATLVVGFVLLLVTLPMVLNKVLPLTEVGLGRAAQLLTGG